MKETLKLILIAFIIFSGIGSSDSWFGYVKTANDTWSIYRHSDNMSFKSDQYIEGKIKAFEGPRGRVLAPYCSYLENMNLNDVRLKERTAAKEGNYTSFELINANSKVIPPISLDINKPDDSDIYTIDFGEEWPANISAMKSLEYSGLGINNQDFSGNNFDFVESNLLYNQKLVKDLFIGMRLDRMNATVIATDDNIIRADKKTTKDLNFKISTSTTGIADFKFQHSGSEFNRAPVTDYEILNMGEERYQGSFNITKDIRMSSRFNDSEAEDHWLPCCYQGFNDMNLLDKRSHNLERIFNCTCPVGQGGVQ